MGSRRRGSRGLWSALAVLAALGLVLLVDSLPAHPCTEPTDASCVRAAYIGAPGVYRRISDIPASARLTPDAAGRYEVRRGQQVSVFTAATLPEGDTRLILTGSPVSGAGPASSARMVTRGGSDYTFTVSEDYAGPVLVTFELRADRSRPGEEREPGEVIVRTVFLVASCSAGTAVPEPAANPGLVGDCESLLAMRETLAETGTLDWSAGRPLAEWSGVTVAGTPSRVTRLRLANRGLTGALSGLVGTLTELTELRLEGNALTGMLPSKMVKLRRLTDLSLVGNAFTVCAPPSLTEVASNDVRLLGLPDCPPPPNIALYGWRSGDLLPPGTYRFANPGQAALVFDIPQGAWIEYESAALGHNRGPGWITFGSVLNLRDRETGSRICLDVGRGVRCDVSSPSDPRVADIFDRIGESLWHP